jgi:hypothetical protein
LTKAVFGNETALSDSDEGCLPDDEDPSIDEPFANVY